MAKIAYEKSKAFAIRIVRLYQYLTTQRREFVISKQILRSGTSIGSNLAESVFAISRNDFQLKIYIALKEASETAYWLELLYETGYLTDTQYQSLNKDCDVLIRILAATTRTLSKPKEGDNLRSNRNSSL